jgi:hypothetical protein
MNDIFFNIQLKIFKFILASGSVSWYLIKNRIDSLLSLLQNLSDDIKVNVTIYSILMPLLRIGIIEICRNPISNSIRYCIAPAIILKSADNQSFAFNPDGNDYRFREIETPKKDDNDMINHDRISLLNQIPSLEKIIKNWELEQVLEMKYIYDRLDKNHYRSLTSKDEINKCAIYTALNKPYSRKYIRMPNGKLYKIPYHDENIDGEIIAVIFCKIYNGEKIFQYSNKNHSLLCFNFSSIIPIVICRAIIINDPSVLLGDEIYQGSHTIEFHDINTNIIIGLKRIFGKTSIKEVG